MYAKSISGNHVEFSLPLAIFWPVGAHTVRFFNYYSHSRNSWIPEPRPFDIQIKSELRYRAKRFLDQSSSSLEKILIELDEVHQVPGLASLTSMLDEIDEAVGAAKRDSDTSNVWKRLGFQGAGKEHALLGRIQIRVEMMRQAVPRRMMDLGQLRQKLAVMSADFDQYPLSFSHQGSITLPPALQERLRLGNFPWLRPDWPRAKPSSLKYNSQTEDSSLVKYQYDLEIIDKTSIKDLRADIANVCWELGGEVIVTGALHQICTLWN